MSRNLDYYKNLCYQIKTEPVTDSDGISYWLAEISELKGCKTEGETETEAIANLQELFDEYVETMLEANIDISEPDPLPEITGEIQWVISDPPAIQTKNLPKEQTKNTAGVFNEENQFTSPINP